LKDDTVRFRSSTHITRSHGSWKYAATTEGDFFCTHFHCNATTDSLGLSQAPPTLLKRYRSAPTFLLEASAPVFFAAGVESEGYHRFVVLDDSQLRHLKSWHIFAQIVYSD